MTDSQADPKAARSRAAKIFWTVLCLAPLGVVLAIVTPNYLRAHHRQPLMACLSNVKNLARALDMYANDNQGALPPRLDDVTPKYLKKVPRCKEADYIYTLDAKRFLITCPADHTHAGMSKGYPQYSSAEGLLTGESRP